MDIIPQDTTQQPISDDQELAKALAGVLPDEPAPTPAVPTQSIVEQPLQFEETPAPVAAPVVDSFATPTPTPLPEPSTPPVAATGNSDLDSIKKDALIQLRPLIDKVELPAEEKFDTYLMLIRSTDDASLIGPAHAAAQEISDEKRRAEALLDIIKEIDYLSHGNKQAA